MVSHLPALSLTDLEQRLLRLLSIDCRGDHISYGLQKIRIVFREGSAAVGMRAQHPERLILAMNNDAHAAYHPVLVQQQRPAETLLLAEILDDHRFPGGQRIAGLRV